MAASKSTLRYHFLFKLRGWMEHGFRIQQC